MAHVIKKGSIKVPTQPKDYDLQATGLVFKSYDNQIALEFNVEQQNGTPADLLGANLRLLMFIYDEVDGIIKKEPIPFITKNLITESFLNGHVVYILPEAMKAYNGMVEAYVYIEYPDGSTSDNLGFTFRMKRSAIDGLAQDKADYFIADFQQLLDGVKQEATDAVNEVLAKVEALTEHANQKITEYDQYFTSGKSDWEDFVNQNKEILESLDPNGALLNQLNDLKNQLDEATNNNSANINDEIMGGIREIFEAPLFDIKNQLESRKNNINIGHITDVHYVVRSDYWGPFPAASYGLTHLLNIGSISDKLDLIFSGGDNADENRSTKVDILKLQRDYATTLETCCDCPIIIGIGNHDDQSLRADANKTPGTDFLVTNAEFAELYFQKENKFGEVRNGESNYCYYDIPNSNIRAIWLDLYQSPETFNDAGILKYPRTNTTVIQQDQLAWLANTALKTNRDIITFSHCNINGTVGPRPAANVYNHDVLLQLLNGFEGKTSGTLLGSNADLPVDVDFDFSGQTGSIISVVCGHHHKDDYLLQNGINYVITAQSVGRDNSGNQFWYTPEEDSWSIFSIDESTKTVEILKFGRGTGRTFSYGGGN